MSARSTRTKNILRVLLLLLVASGISFVVERARIHNGAETIGRIVAKRRVPHPVGPTGDPYEIVIEYEANGRATRFSTRRSVWDALGPLDRMGQTVPVWYLPDGRAYIKGFVYLYPVTATLLAMMGIGLVSLAFVRYRWRAGPEN